MKRTRLSHLAAAILATLVGTISCVQAQDYPTKPIRLVTGFPAGGPTDLGARRIAAALQKALNQPVVVENKPGASGIIAGEALAQAAPDGYTLLYTSSATQTTVSHMMDRMSFDPLKDYTPIYVFASATLILAVRDDSPFKTAEQLIDHARQNPGKLAYGSAGIGSSPHLYGELFAARTKAQFLHVPYKGNAQSAAGLLGGDTAFAFVGVSETTELIQSGKLRVLAVATPERHPRFPDVPTMTEIGVQAFNAEVWFALEGPPKLPKEIVDKLVRASADVVMTDPAVLKFYNDAGYRLLNEGPEKLRDRVNNEFEAWRDIMRTIKAAGN